MSLHVNEDFLQFNDYQPDSSIYHEDTFFEAQGSEKFNEKSAKQMLLMMNQLSAHLNLDAYALKRLEVTLHEDIPFYATNRRLVFNWASEIFLY